MRRYILLSALLLLFAASGAVAQGKKTATKGDGGLPPQLEKYALMLEYGDAREKEMALPALLDSGNDDALKRALAVLNQDSADPEEARAIAQLRRQIILGVVQHMPDRAYDIFADLVRNGQPRQRESAAFGLGHVDDPRARELALTFVDAQEPIMRRASAYSLTTDMRDLVARATQFTYGDGEPLTDADRALFARRAELLAERITTEPTPQWGEIYQLAEKAGNSESASTIVTAYAKGGDAAGLGATIQRIQRVNRRWLGRAEPAPVGQVAYTFVMENVMTGKRHEIPVVYDAAAMEILRYDSVYVDRGTVLALPLDMLAFYPQALSPRQTAADEKAGTIELEYGMPGHAVLAAGMGSFAGGYWITRTDAVHRSRVVVDSRRAVPLSETLYQEDGSTLATLRYDDYVALDGDALVPRAITIDVRATEDVPHLRYELEFQVLEPGVWIYRAGKALAILDGEPEVRGLSAAIDVEISRE
ncbi:MAG: hypothetical protein GY716_11155 [bacterium]|nr:hypothetical protein [bacterium]